MGKYDPLRQYLAAQDGEQIPMTFAQIERLLGLELPASKRFPAWWSNNPSNNTMTRAWLDAGFTTEQVDAAVGRVVFRRAASGGGPNGGWLAELRAAMAGTVQVAAGWDLTNPTGEIWDAQGAWDAKGE